MQRARLYKTTSHAQRFLHHFPTHLAARKAQMATTRPRRTSVDHIIRHDLLYRLHWNVFSTLDSIQIATGPSDGKKHVSLYGDPLAKESIANPPITCARLHIGDCGDRKNMQAAHPTNHRLL
jgi:hypothetical protein